MVKSDLKNLLLLMVGFLLILTSCSDKEEPNGDAKKVECAITFKYVDNFIGSSMYPEFAQSCSMWVFDKDGKLVLTHSDTGSKIASKDYTVNLSLPEGEYDFITWFGIAGETMLELGANPPVSKEDLSLSLKLDYAVGGSHTSFSSALPVIYHGLLSDVTVSKSKAATTGQKLTMNLLRDSKTVGVLLHAVNSDIDLDNYKLEITNGNNLITWDNITKSTQKFSYLPANYKVYGSWEDLIPQKIMRVEFSIFPLTKDSDEHLILIRKSDNKELANISLVEYFLEHNKPKEFDGSDEEYLARKDHFDLSFYITGESNEE